MRKLNQNGRISVLLPLLILSVLLLAGAAAFGLWAYAERADYKANSDKKSAAAVAASSETVKAQLQAVFDEQEKQPVKAYKGPSAYGGVTFNFPKTWSAYVVESSNSTPLASYFHPNFVPGIQSETAYALRVEVVEQDYPSVLKTLDSNIKSGKLATNVFTATNVNNQLGTLFQGELPSTRNKTVKGIYIPLRDKTIKLWTEAPEFFGDFDTTVVPSFTFNP
jgi:hypothetical protein